MNGVRTTSSFRWLMILAAVPVVLAAIFWSQLLGDPRYNFANLNFFVSTATAVIVLVLAGMMFFAAFQLQDARIVHWSIAFLGLAGGYMSHGLMTPGALVDTDNPWFMYTFTAALFSGSVSMAMSTTRNSSFNAGVIRHQIPLTIMSLAINIVVWSMILLDTAYPANGVSPSTRFQYMDSSAVLQIVAIPTVVLLGWTGIYYARLFKRFESVLSLAMAWCAILLAEAQVIILISPKYSLSFWLCHLIVFVAVIGAVVGIALEYRTGDRLDQVMAGLIVRDTDDQVQRGFTDVIMVLVNAVEAKDEHTRGHTLRVTELAVQVGRHMNISADGLRTLTQAAMLHDIGKIGIPDSILNKPGPLTQEEFEVVKTHPVYGFEIVRDVRSLQNTLGGIRHHHEKMNGSGYPDRLVGDEIPIEARIIAVADVYDALTSDRSYRPAWSVGRALQQIRNEAGDLLDPDCANALIHVIENRDRAELPELDTLLQHDMMESDRAAG